jgi:hypothetical protein
VKIRQQFADRYITAAMNSCKTMEASFTSIAGYDDRAVLRDDLQKSLLRFAIPGVHPNALPARLSRFTVLDLTRIRSGPTCVRQLADWGANVIKIDALSDDADSEQPGGPRQGADFQNLHRNKRA